MDTAIKSPLEADDVLEQAAAWLAGGRKIALATVIRTWGSSPRPVGSQLVVDENGSFLGSVSGGCIEGAVIGEAIAAMKDGEPRTLEFGVSDEQAWEVGLACGGNVHVYVRPESETGVIQQLIDARPIVVATDLQTGERTIIRPGEPAADVSEELAEASRAAIRDDKSTTLDSGGAQVFVHAFNKPLRMFIVGAVHISQALVPMARLAGYDVTVIDPRGAFATEARFPEVALSEEWPDDAIDALKIDSRTAVVTLTHDPKLDDPALDRALKSDCFYIGALGSKRTHGKRLERLTEIGFGEKDFARIHAPVGLDLGATSPAEIAVSILAEIVAAKHGKEPLN
jgi:xanthine dehydrogenase accessory factor